MVWPTAHITQLCLQLPAQGHVNGDEHRPEGCRAVIERRETRVEQISKQTRWVLLGKSTKKTHTKLTPVLVTCSNENDVLLQLSSYNFRPMNLLIFGYLLDVDST